MSTSSKPQQATIHESHTTTPSISTEIKEAKNTALLILHVYGNQEYQQEFLSSLKEYAPTLGIKVASNLGYQYKGEEPKLEVCLAANVSSFSAKNIIEHKLSSEQKNFRRKEVDRQRTLDGTYESYMLSTLTNNTEDRKNAEELIAVKFEEARKSEDRSGELNLLLEKTVLQNAKHILDYLAPGETLSTHRPILPTSSLTPC